MSTIATYQHVEFHAAPVSPASAITSLQVVCFFDQSKNQNYAGGTEQVDQHFGGKIRQLRSENIFHGERFETLLLSPLDQKISAKHLLMIGLGDPATLNADVLHTVGGLAVREALKLGVPDFAFAPSLKDAGVETVPAAEVSHALAHGMMGAIKSAHTLVERRLQHAITLKQITFLAGPEHIDNARAGLAKAFGVSHKISGKG